MKKSGTAPEIILKSDSTTKELPENSFESMCGDCEFHPFLFSKETWETPHFRMRIPTQLGRNAVFQTIRSSHQKLTD